jgi:hypothetical protein
LVELSVSMLVMESMVGLKLAIVLFSSVTIQSEGSRTGGRKR